MTLVTVRGLEKTYSSGSETIRVLRGVDFDLEEGEAVALMGPSGVGKSTLLHMLAGLDAPDGGAIRINGNDLAALRGNHLDAFRRTTVGVVYQFHFLLPEFTALENVMLPAIIAGRGREARAAAARLLEEVGLSGRVDHTPARLSGGEQQRVAIARALVNAPRLLLADEPTGNLDESTAAQVFDLLMDLRRSRGLTFLMATHNPGLAASCTRTLRLKDGKIG